jgi:hypothetical protein
MSCGPVDAWQPEVVLSLCCSWLGFELLCSCQLTVSAACHSHEVPPHVSCWSCGLIIVSAALHSWACVDSIWDAVEGCVLMQLPSKCLFAPMSRPSCWALLSDMSNMLFSDQCGVQSVHTVLMCAGCNAEGVLGGNAVCIHMLLFPFDWC